MDMDVHNARMAKMSFATVFPLYLAKIEKKGRTKEELLLVISWLTGFDEISIQNLIAKTSTSRCFSNMQNLIKMPT